MLHNIIVVVPTMTLIRTIWPLPN